MSIQTQDTDAPTDSAPLAAPPGLPGREPRAQTPPRAEELAGPDTAELFAAAERVSTVLDVAQAYGHVFSREHEPIGHRYACELAGIDPDETKES